MRRTLRTPEPYNDVSFQVRILETDYPLYTIHASAQRKAAAIDTRNTFNTNSSSGLIVKLFLTTKL